MRSVVALGLAAALAVTGPSLARQPAGPPAKPAESAKIAAVSPEASMAAFNALAAWVRALAVPEDARPPKGLDAMTGCSVALRLDHHVIGRATRFGGPPELLRAARAAISEALPRLPVGHDALAEQQLKEAAERIAISLELAGTLVPVKLASFADADAELDPGLDGVAARFGDKLAGTFPAPMLIMSKTPGECLASAISEASGDPTLAIPGSPKNEAGAIAAEQHATYYRFRVTHVVQTEGAKAPMFLFRSGHVVQAQEIDAVGISAMAEALASNLAARAFRRTEGAPEPTTYVPSQGRFETSANPTFDSLLSAAALAQWASLWPAGKVRDSRLYDAYAELESAKDIARQRPLDAAAWIVLAATLDAAPRPPNKAEGARTDPDGTARLGLIDMNVVIDPAARAKIGAVVASAFDAETGWTADAPPSARAFVAYALALESLSPGLDGAEQATRLARAQAAIAGIYKDTPPKMLVSQTPWLGRAELALAGDAKELPFAPALRDMRAQVWDHQLTPDDAGADGPDLIGGIVFTSARNPLPTWHSVRPIILLAQIARDPRLTDDNDKMREISRLLAATRFLRQLMTDDAAAYSAEDPDAAIGGIRASLWDQRQPIEATAMTLMAVCEIMKTLGIKPQQ